MRQRSPNWYFVFVLGVHAILEPSGDHVGDQSVRSEFVRFFIFVPSAFSTQMSACTYEPHMRAIFVPSGDQEGSALCRPVSILTKLLPSGSSSISRDPW